MISGDFNYYYVNHNYDFNKLTVQSILYITSHHFSGTEPARALITNSKLALDCRISTSFSAQLLCCNRAVHPLYYEDEISTHFPYEMR
ncbi:hypothetical protein TNCT_645241 [Trichonephila clavata]|uniref:Uncharacterized protein n=1 Tax=Trichonephila clavata TaxID=2740835 RepID=A0A8X6HIB0_TRICU|nr:hypothetical protein TNCT_645241 [Trichonephila clavata]